LKFLNVQNFKLGDNHMNETALMFGRNEANNFFNDLRTLINFFDKVLFCHKKK
jgi:hypothetical protein